MIPHASDATGWYLFEEYEHGVNIEYPVGISHGIETRAERRFSYVPQNIALAHWYRVVVPHRRNRYFYGETALTQAREFARNAEREAWKDVIPS